MGWLVWCIAVVYSDMHLYGIYIYVMYAVCMWCGTMLCGDRAVWKMLIGVDSAKKSLNTASGETVGGCFAVQSFGEFQTG